MQGTKHLIECHCVLAIFKSTKNDMPSHKFPVYSKIDQNEKVIPKFVKCNNCDTMHYVHDICRSEIRGGKDQSELNVTESELSLMLPERLSNALLKIETDISNWEHIVDIFEEERWGELVVLRREVIDEKQYVKTIEISTSSIFKIKNNVINDMIGWQVAKQENKIKLINQKNEARKICKTILEFGVSDDQKIEIMFNLSLSLESNENMKEIVNFLKKFNTNFNTDENSNNIDTDNKNKILLE